MMDARLLVEAAAGAPRADILSAPRRALTSEQVSALDALVERRASREPISHILGRKGFWKIMLTVTPDVLTPRPETELVVERALHAFPEGKRLSVLDLGVGSGAILLAILAERPAAGSSSRSGMNRAGRFRPCSWLPAHNRFRWFRTSNGATVS